MTENPTPPEAPTDAELETAYHDLIRALRHRNEICNQINAGVDQDELDAISGLFALTRGDTAKATHYQAKQASWAQEGESLQPEMARREVEVTQLLETFNGLCKAAQAARTA